MAIKTYYYKVAAASVSKLASLLAPAASPSLDAPLTDNPYVPVTLDETNKEDLDAAMESLGFEFVFEADATAQGKVRLITTADSPYTPGDELLILANATAGPITIALPSLTSLTPNERQLKIQKTDVTGNAIVLDPFGAETINGVGTFSISVQYDSAEIFGSILRTTWALLLQPSGTPPPPTSIPETTLTAGEALVAGNVCVIDGVSGLAFKASATTAIGRTSVIAVVKDPAIALGFSGQFYTMVGALVPVLFGVAPGAASNGAVIYLDTTSGQAILSAPIATGTAIVELGVLQAADGVTVTPLTIFGPDFRSEAA